MRILFTLIVSKGSIDIDYQLGSYFGQVLYDTSGNSNYANNGETSLAETYDTTPTDRGAYFDTSLLNKIKLPPNEAQTAVYNLNNPSVIVFWVMFLDSDIENFLFYRCTPDELLGFSLKRLTDLSLSLSIKIDTFEITAYNILAVCTNSNFYTDIWHFIALQIDQYEHTLFLDGNQEIYIVSSDKRESYYYDEGTQQMISYIGYKSDIISSFNGFLWSFTIYDSLISLTDYYNGLYTPGNCLSSSCPTSCNPSLKINGISYCISESPNPYEDSSGNSCPIECLYGCNSNICLECSCLTDICYYSNNKISCECPDLLSCICNSGFYFDGNYCVPCNSDCNECIDSTGCSTCIANNAFIDFDGLCKCDEKYWGTLPLENRDSCFQCHTNCKTCSNSDFCDDCLSLNSIPDEEFGGCVCKSGFFNTTALNAENACKQCFSDCETCEQDYVCLTCIKENAIPVEAGGCICEEGYYDSSNSCYKCIENCQVCSDFNECLKCNPGYYFDYERQENGCAKYTFTSYLDILKNNSVAINFTEELKNNLEQKNVIVTIEDIKFRYGFIRLSNLTYLIPIKYLSDVKYNTTIYVSFVDIELIGVKNETYAGNLLEGKLYEMIYFISYSAVEIAINSTDIGVRVALSASIVSSLISNPSTIWIFLSLFQFISYIPLNSNPLTPLLKILFCGFNIGNMFPNPFSGYNHIPQSRPYLEARRYGIETGSFIYNAGLLIVNFFIILGAFPFIFIMKKLKLRFVSNKCNELLENYRFSVFLRYWIQSYLDLGFFAIINIRTVTDKKVGNYNWMDTFSLGVSYIVIVTYIQMIIVITPLALLAGSLLSYENIYSQDNEEYTSKWGSLFSEFKNNKGFWSTQYYLFYFIRRLIFIMAQVYLNSYLFFQGALNICLSLLSLIFLLIFKPYKEKTILISSLSAEGCILMVNILVYPILFDIQESKQSLKTIEAVIVMIIYIEIGIQTGISAYEAAIKAKELVNKAKEIIYKKRYEVNKITDIEETRNYVATTTSRKSPFDKSDMISKDI